MDQPKISRILRLIVLMSGNRIYTVDELAAELETSQRTIYRYIDTFKEAGFAVEKVDDYKYRLVNIGKGGEGPPQHRLFFPGGGVHRQQAH